MEKHFILKTVIIVLFTIQGACCIERKPLTSDEHAKHFNIKNFTSNNKNVDFHKIDSKEIVNKVFVYVTFKKSDLSHLDLKNVKFLYCKFIDTRFIESTFNKCIFYKCLFDECKLEKNTFNNCTFKKLQTTASSFNLSVFNNCEFKSSKIATTEFNGVKYQSVLYDNTQVSGCNSMENAEGSNISFTDCDLYGITYSGKFNKINFYKSKIKALIFLNANLSHITIEKCHYMENFKIVSSQAAMVKMINCRYILNPMIGMSKIDSITIQDSEVFTLWCRYSEFTGNNIIKKCLIQGVDLKDAKVYSFVLEDSDLEYYVITENALVNNLKLINIKYLETKKSFKIYDNGVQYNNSDKFEKISSNPL